MAAGHLRAGIAFAGAGGLLTGHMAPLERPDEVNRRLRALAARADGIAAPTRGAVHAA